MCLTITFLQKYKILNEYDFQGAIDKYSGEICLGGIGPLVSKVSQGFGGLVGGMEEGGRSYDQVVLSSE